MFNCPEVNDSTIPICFTSQRVCPPARLIETFPFESCSSIWMSKSIRTRTLLKVPAGTFTGCVVTKDFSQLERKVTENKWFARGIGLVKSMNVKGGTDTAELVSVR